MSIKRADPEHATAQKYPAVEIVSVKPEAENLNVRAAVVHMLGDMV